MSLFVVGCALLLGVGALVLLRPGQARRAEHASLAWATTAFAVVFTPLIYFYVGTPTLINSKTGGNSADDVTLTKALAARVARDSNDVQAWRDLGRQFLERGQLHAAAGALGEARSRSNEVDDDLELDYAESQILSNQSALIGEAGRIVEGLLNKRPDDVRVLLYSGLAAMASGRDGLARDRLSRVLAVDDVPDGLKQLVRLRLSELDGESPVATDAGSLSVAVTLDDVFGEINLTEYRALYLFARDSGGGPPIAVQRHRVTQVPGQFVLTDADAMIPQRTLSRASEVTVVARLSKSGEPVQASGDLFGEQRVVLADTKHVEIAIDRRVEPPSPN